MNEDIGISSLQELEKLIYMEEKSIFSKRTSHYKNNEVIIKTHSYNKESYFDEIFLHF